MTPRKRFIAALLIFCLSIHVTYGFPASAELPAIETDANDILIEEIQLMRLNTYLEREYYTTNFYKPGLKWALVEGGALNTFAGITTTAIYHWKKRSRPANARKSVLEAGPLLLLIGHMLLLVDPILDKTFSLLQQRSLKDKGLDAETLLNKSTTLIGKIETAISLREKNTAEAKTYDSKFAVETRVMRDILNLEELFFVQSYSSQRSKLAVTTEEFIDRIAMASTGGFLGALLAYLSARNNAPRDNGPAGLGFVLSGALICLDPPLRKTAQLMASHAAASRCKKIFGTKQPMDSTAQLVLAGQLEVDLAKLESINSVEQKSSVSEAFARDKKIFAQAAEIKRNQKKQENRDFINRLILDEILGGTKIAWGVCLAEAGFSYSHMTKVAYQHIAAGSTAFIVGTGYQALNNTVRRAYSATDKAKQKQVRTLPSQRLEGRLMELDEMQKILSSAK